MVVALNNNRDQHIDKVKQIIFAYLEAVRRKQSDEAYLIRQSLKQLGCHISFWEPQVISNSRQAERY